MFLLLAILTALKYIAMVLGACSAGFTIALIIFIAVREFKDARADKDRRILRIKKEQEAARDSERDLFFSNWKEIYERA